MAEELRRLPGPMEFLELRDGETARLKVVSWERGKTLIHTTRWGREVELDIPVLRVHLAAGVKPYPPMYYDITSKTLTAQLVPMLMESGFERYTYVITKHGVRPRARFTLERVGA